MTQKQLNLDLGAGKKYSQRSEITRMLSAPYQVHSQTSREAAEAIKPRAGTLMFAVLQIIRSSGSNGLTDEEIANRSVRLDGVPMTGPNTLRPRRIDLVARGLVRDSGLTRKTRSGRQATVWVAVEC